MANQLSILLNAILTVTDQSLNPSPTIITRNLNNPTLLAGAVFYDPNFPGGTVNLPALTVYFVYVKNVQLTGNITVGITPVGGVGTSFVLLPGSPFIYFLTAESGGGVTVLSTSNATTSEVMVAA